MNVTILLPSECDNEECSSTRFQLTNYSDRLGNQMIAATCRSCRNVVAKELLETFLTKINEQLVPPVGKNPYGYTGEEF